MPLPWQRWPFVEDRHRQFCDRLLAWADDFAPGVDERDVDEGTRRWVQALGRQGFLKSVFGGGKVEVRLICLARDILAYRSGLADSAFAMQGLGSGPISLFGSDGLRARYLPAVEQGDAIAAFAVSEPEAGSDVAALRTTATPDGAAHVRLNGAKTWISNGGIADFYVVLARSGEAPGAKGLSAYVVDAHTPGLSVSERFELMAPLPIASLRFDDVRVPLSMRVGGAGEGFKVIMATLDIFRCTVGAAAVGMARRALDEAISRASQRHIFGKALIELQLSQAAIAESAVEVDAAALLVYRAAWMKDTTADAVTAEAAMAKLFATEVGQKVIDRAVQLHGGMGVRAGVTVEKLYRFIRALRIYEGASEVQKIVIARELVKARRRAPGAS